MPEATAAEAIREGGQSLGRRVIEFRPPAAHAVLGGLVSLGALASATGAYLRGRPFLSVFLAVGGAALAYVLLRPQLYARVIVYQNGIGMTDGRRRQDVLWEDVADIRAGLPAVGKENGYVSVVIRRRSGGGIVLQDDWRPRREYRALLERLQRWSKPESGADGSGGVKGPGDRRLV